ncbi:hypothetical protein [Halochromatium sp.]
MIIDTLTIAGFMSAASFLLMPILMKKEFIRVETGAESQAQPAYADRRCHPHNSTPLSASSVPTA